VRTMLKSKIHRAIVTDACLDYEGSVTIAPELMEAADILPYERVDVLDVTNGHRLQTYAIRGSGRPGEICINGAAAHLVHKGHLVIILTYQELDEASSRSCQPRIVLVDEKNGIRSPRTPADCSGSVWNRAQDPRQEEV